MIASLPFPASIAAHSCREVCICKRVVVAGKEGTKHNGCRTSRHESRQGAACRKAREEVQGLQDEIFQLRNSSREVAETQDKGKCVEASLAEIASLREQRVKEQEQREQLELRVQQLESEVRSSRGMADEMERLPSIGWAW